MSDKIEVGSIWYNDYQKLEVEITCVKDGYICYNYIGLNACGFCNTKVFLSQYSLVYRELGNEQSNKEKPRLCYKSTL